VFSYNTFEIVFARDDVSGAITSSVNHCNNQLRFPDSFEPGSVNVHRRSAPENTHRGDVTEIQYLLS